MSSGDADRFITALAALQRALDGVGAPWMCIGGVAVIAHGVPRYTADIDATIAAEGLEPSTVLDAVGREQLRARIPDAVVFARRHHVLLVRHDPTMVPVDISFAWLPFEQEAIGESRRVEHGGVSIRVPRPEDLIVYKLVASRPRDVDDATKLLRLHRRDISVQRIRSLLVAFSEALGDSTRVDTLDRLLREAHA